MATHISKSPEETYELGRQVGRFAVPGLVVGLVGELGAGKTQFVKGVAAGLNVTERVHSPTFALINEYRSGRLPCYHLDLYRLNHFDEVFGAGLGDYLFQEDGVSLVEWFDRVESEAGRLGPGTLIVRISGMGETERELHYENPGA